MASTQDVDRPEAAPTIAESTSDANVRWAHSSWFSSCPYSSGRSSPRHCCRQSPSEPCSSWPCALRSFVPTGRFASGPTKA